MIRFIRSSLVPLTMPLAFLLGIPVLIWTRSRRRTTNFSSALWADMVCALIGLKLDVSGAEYLGSPRPAMFLLNHQSNVDGFLVGKLIRRDLTYLSKKELSRQWPIRSWLMRQAGQILVDRDDSSQAGKAMQQMISAIRKEGLSGAIFPEGRRSQSTTLLPFKKGAFVTALRAKVPLVPIVIHNSIDAQPQGESFFNPSVVRIDVLAPIDTSGWRVKNLDQHMAEVRTMFLESLGQTDQYPSG